MARRDGNPYVRRFTVPAGTALPNGTTLRETVTFFGEGESEIKAKRAARRIAAAELSETYGTPVGVTDLTRRTAAINKPAGRARGGRPPKEFPLQAEQRYQGKRVDIYLGKPSPLFKTIRRALAETIQQYPNWDISIAGKGRITGHQGPDYERVQWVSTEAFDSLAYFDRRAPNHRAFADWLGVQLRGSEEWTIILYDRNRQKSPSRRKGSSGRGRR